MRFLSSSTDFLSLPVPKASQEDLAHVENSLNSLGSSEKALSALFIARFGVKCFSIAIAPNPIAIDEAILLVV